MTKQKTRYLFLILLTFTVFFVGFTLDVFAGDNSFFDDKKDELNSKLKMTSAEYRQKVKLLFL
ncbi:hypothetical protein [Dethiothermospora halolimnae]|uniref:hypothetical protein n=1 Tax=Dethiothermospora halolimnae TaxID=3114390 RepID=UPI003CCB86BC